ncbi:hypothetical protein [Clostridium sp. UBA1056]|uniref:hypothetical protein n=1 Tax=unclassified Clostridium TaxID=2614128 RepID=UPI0032180F88
MSNKYHYEFQYKTDNNRNILEKLKDRTDSSYIAPSVNVIYIYSLVDSKIPYPNKEGKVLYIGESCKHKQPTGLRFSQHIASSEYGTRGRNINYTLHKYYWNGIKLSLDIYDVGDVTNDERKAIERDLINAHIKIYGAPPIAQGTSGVLVDNIDNVDEIKAQSYF